MIPEQMTLVACAKRGLMMAAHVWSSKTIAGTVTDHDERAFLRAAREWVHAVDAVDRKLWEPPSACVEGPATQND